METIYLSGRPIHVGGSMPAVGNVAPEFNLVSKDLATVSLNQFLGRHIVLNIFPSLDTPVCAASVRRFNQAAASLNNVSVICVSMDLPFAMQRFCSLEGIDNLVAASAFRSPQFAEQYGVRILDGPLAYLLARAVVVIDTSGKIAYHQLVQEITQEPDYKSALSAIN